MNENKDGFLFSIWNDQNLIGIVAIECVEIFADPQVQKVFYNLIENSLPLRRKNQLHGLLSRENRRKPDAGVSGL